MTAVAQHYKMDRVYLNWWIDNANELLNVCNALLDITISFIIVIYYVKNTSCKILRENNIIVALQVTCLRTIEKVRYIIINSCFLLVHVMLQCL